MLIVNNLFYGWRINLHPFFYWSNNDNSYYFIELTFLYPFSNSSLNLLGNLVFAISIKYCGTPYTAADDAAINF